MEIDTWALIDACFTHKVHLREDAITAFNLVRIKKAGLSCVDVIDTHSSESTSGCDLELYVQTSKGWLGHAIQAKRVSLPGGKYMSLAHKVGAKLQKDLLKAHALKHNLVPLYAFYNFWDSAPGSSTVTATTEQWGCSITPLSIVETALKTPGTRNYDWIHKRKETKPWRYLVCDSDYLDPSKLSPENWPAKSECFRRELPAWIQARRYGRHPSIKSDLAMPEGRPRFVVLVGSG